MIARIAAIGAGLALLAGPAAGEPSQGRTLDELKAEAQARADRGAYPLIGLKPAEVREALAGIHSLERDEWAASWSKIADRYMQKAQAERAGAPAEADKDFLQAWLYYSFARWPVPNSPGKQRAYEQALAAYREHGKLLDPPIEIVRLPFEGGEIVGYVQMPKGAQRAPVIVAVSGLDSRKEDMAERFRPLLANGIGSLSLDSPGTGEAPLKVAPGAERMLVHAMDVVLQRPDVDAARVALYGGSFGGYWATLLAATEQQRLRAVVAQSPPVEEIFSHARTMALPDNREYLFDYVPAQFFIYPNVSNLEQLAAARAKVGLKTLGLLDKPMPPMLVIGGVHDTQVPIADIDLLLHSGTTPKEAWINPAGGHMGRDAKVWSDPVIFKKITTPWLLRALDVRAE
jgi:pimeloyl-ACP methyl ester carboxylesterase